MGNPPVPAPSGFRRIFTALSIPNYRLFFAGQLVSVIGTWMQRVAQDWLILEIGGGPIELAIGVALQSVPTLLLGVWGGLLVDRSKHVRQLLLASQLGMALLALTLGLLTETQHVNLATIYISAFLVGLLNLVDKPARQSFVLEMVDESQAANAISLNSSINNAARLIGPAIAGVVIGIAGSGVAFLLNSLTFVAIVVALMLMRRDQLTPRPPEPRGGGQVRAGVAYAWRDHDIRLALVATLVVSALAQNFRVVLPLMAADVFDAGPSAYGWLMSFLGIGAIVGALICAYLASPSIRMITVELALFGVVTILASLAPTYALMLALMLGVGAGNTSFNTTSNALVLLAAAPGMRGRILSLRNLMSNGATPAGSLAIGWVCQVWDARAGLAVGGLVCLLACVFLASRARSGSSSTVDQPRTDLGAPEPEPPTS
ncbi:MAG TPA: MFS transporter [Nonomuraea sp.]|nr:MFS transporter [Nonomuraea sp.]